MSATKQRIAQHARTVKEAGLRGEDMSTALRKIAEQDDLSGNEIRRIAEESNRHVQLDLYKVAGDKRFKFALADGPGIAKEAEARCSKTKKVKVAGLSQAIDQAGGDPFAAPVRYNEAEVSLLSTKISSQLERDLVDCSDREKIAELDKARLELEDLLKVAQADEITTISQVHKTHDSAIQSAMDLILSGITLPSLYESILAGLSGSATKICPEDATEFADDITELIIEGLKKRGVRNYQMGFRHKGRPDLLEKLTTEDLIALCHRASAYAKAHHRDLSMWNVKCSEYLSGYINEASSAEGKPLRPQDAEDILKNRGSQNGIYAVPQAYLGDVADNTPNGAPRVVNADHEFVVDVIDLVGEQQRLRKCHGAQEYLGLKLKQIEAAISELADVRRASEDWHKKDDKREDAAQKLRPDQVKKTAGGVTKAIEGFNSTKPGKILSAAGGPAVMLPTMAAGMAAQAREQKAVNAGVQG